MKEYKIYFEDKLIKVYKYRACMLKYVYRLRHIEFSKSSHMTDKLRVVGPFGQIYFV